jgi:hypothetical protein
VIGLGAIPNKEITSVRSYEKPRYIHSYEMVAGVWERSDALWYISIAKYGYEGDKHKSVFMPLYPMLTRIVKYTTGLPWLSAALLVSNLSLVFALYFIYKLSEMEKDEKVARRAVWYQALFPGSLFLLAPYTESLFLALATGSFYAAKQKKWWLAGIAGAFLSCTRNFGAIIIIPLAIEFIRQRRGKEPIPWKNALWMLLVPVGILGVMLFWWYTNGNPLTFVQGQDNWQRSFSLPWITVGNGIKQAYNYGQIYPGAIYVLEAAAVVIALVLGALAFEAFPSSYGVFTFLAILPALIAPFPGRVFMSCMRFSSVLFPVFMTLASISRNENVDQAIKLIFAGLFGLSVALYVTCHYMF